MAGDPVGGYQKSLDSCVSALWSSYYRDLFAAKNRNYQDSYLQPLELLLVAVVVMTVDH